VSRIPRQWDEETDVAVVGFGYAGGMTAVAAHDAGARVLILEKMPDPGGISVCSAGGLRIARDAGQAFQYLKATNAGTTPDDVLSRLAQGMTELPDLVHELAAVDGAVVGVRDSAANYPLPGHETFGFVYIDDLPGFDPAQAFPCVKGSAQGARLFKVMFDNVARRAIPVRTSARARRLVQDAEGVVIGLIAEITGREVAIRARRAVVLACGGFEGDAELQRQHWQIKPVLSAAYRGNTGDGIRMAQAAGAQLWHMWHFHGSYGFRHPDPAYPFAIRMKRLPDWLPGTGLRGDVRMAWIMVDRGGRRFTNEYDPYMQDTGQRALERFDPVTQSYPRIPATLIVDEEGRKLYPLGVPTYNERGLAMGWSQDNLAEVQSGLIARAQTLDELADHIGVVPATLQATVKRWNEMCAAGADAEFGRPPASMVPIATPPFYFAHLWPVVSNTQGGPAHDAEQRVLDAFGQPIPRLFAAGELGSVFGHLYMSGGNLAECFVGGRTAGRNAAAMAG
jgi:succinate dehydrogenase/fumarate reductase flavoprotein subunit